MVLQFRKILKFMRDLDFGCRSLAVFKVRVFGVSSR
jgi:hypothetical protein